jgi:hypothetical protein
MPAKLLSLSRLTQAHREKRRAQVSKPPNL